MAFRPSWPRAAATDNRKLPLMETCGKGFVVNLRVTQRSREGLERITLELEEQEKMQEELQAVWVWLTAADGLLSEIDLSGSTAQPQVRPPCGSASEQIRCGQGLQSLES